MRRYLFLVSFCALVTTPAFGERKSLQPFAADVKEKESAERLQQARRKAAGIPDLQAFAPRQEAPPKSVPWRAIGLAVVVLGATAPFGWKMYTSTCRELEDPSTSKSGRSRGEAEPREESGESAPVVRRPSRRRAVGSAESSETRIVDAARVERSPRDAVWDAIVSAQGDWVTAEWVATKTAMQPPEVEDEIGALVDEGYLKEAHDRSGRPVFRTA